MSLQSKYADLASCFSQLDDVIVVEVMPDEVKTVPETPKDRETPTTLEELSASVGRRFDAVDRRFEAVDRRFDGVDAAIVEQRQYTEFAFDQLKQDLSVVKQDLDVVKQDLDVVKQDVAVVKSGFGRLERKIDRLIDREPPTGGSESSAPQ
jgi:phosphate-selective porin